MAPRKLFPATIWVWRSLTGRIARRVYLSIVLLLLIASTTARVYTIVLTRRIYAVLSSLERLRIDQTTETELVKTVPYLNRGNYEAPLGASVERFYYAVISNESSWMKLANIVYGRRGEWFPHKWLLKGTDWLGFRYLRLDAAVVVLDGKVSRVSYGIAPELGFPRQASYIVSAKSVHGFWDENQRGFGVTHTDDESPQFRVNGGDRHLYVTFTFDAPPDLTSHAFKVELSCFWSLRECRTARQIAPLLWKDKERIEGAAVARLKSSEPCPDRILAGRVRYLLDVDLVSLEAKRTRTMKINEDGHDADEPLTDFRLVDVLRGYSRKSWSSVRSPQFIPSPANPSERIFNPAMGWHPPGTRALLFANHFFYSCAMVPATPTALSTVRNAVPAPKREEDKIICCLQ